MTTRFRLEIKRCEGCGRPFHVRRVVNDHPEAPELLELQGGGYVGFAGDESTLVVLLCSEACARILLGEDGAR